VLEQGPLPVASVMTLVAGLAEGLAAIHAAAVVHRDLKPSNIRPARAVEEAAPGLGGSGGCSGRRRGRIGAMWAQG
jgi:hypothetical protein